MAQPEGYVMPGVVQTCEVSALGDKKRGGLVCDDWLVQGRHAFCMILQ